MLVLEVFYNLSQDARALVEIFLNYDCDFDSIDLFKRIVHALAKVAKGRTAIDFQGNRWAINRVCY
jgi:brefeldin A-inhibited guanine nucleotide-exchange protein